MNAPANTNLLAPRADRRLTLQEVLNDMVAAKLVSKEAADKLVADRRQARANVHPLIVIAEQKWKDPRNPKKNLHLESLTEWLAENVGLPYLHIDPFKIDFAAVTKVMSNAYAERYKILPVGVSAREATIAICEPHVREWEEQLKHVLRLDIKRVIANPQDIQ
ncbi:MAG: GspE/PulE/PilB domain-containing protein, partial [Burkholderiales bacterium]